MSLDLSWDELEAAGLCECGQRLDEHTPLPRPGPLSSRSPHQSAVSFGTVSGRRWSDAQITAYERFLATRPHRARRHPTRASA